MKKRNKAIIAVIIVVVVCVIIGLCVAKKGKTEPAEQPAESVQQEQIIENDGDLEIIIPEGEDTFGE